MIQLNNITKVFRKDKHLIHALKDVNLTVEKGEFLSIIGPNGSGKSTLLFTIAGLTSPSGGEVFINNTSLYTLSQRDRTQLRAAKYGFIFQEFYLVPYLTAFENVQLPFLSGIRRYEDPEQETKIKNVLNRLGLENRFTHKPEELSTGERQRVAIARALVKSPDIILADEPTGNIDKESISLIMDYFKELHNREGRTIVLVSHNEKVTQSSSRILKILEGCLRD